MISFQADGKLEATLEALRVKLNAVDRAEVLVKAVALLLVAEQLKRDDGTIVIKHPQYDSDTTVKL